ncbi:MAG: copper resistance system multicopper oxidase [Xanthomonadales bacterium]|nr:copper resistance system multicopper oxidase [Xanthomonadales bacterium]ODU74308.1 MAG: copper resistance protein CopA [Rhodanobacter sp. SCN 69-32]OJY84098.1 MAG: copper resistance protein CopA [Xanthomonadales bacterium 66-474]
MEDRKPLPGLTLPGFSRRRFVQGLALGGAAAALGAWPKLSWASTAPGQPNVLSGTEFNLDIAPTPANFTGHPTVAHTINGQLPGPILRWREGTTVTLRVTNRLPVQSSIHWHGIIVPADMDGVPGISFPGIAPGETFVYRFPVKQSGTYWYHSHSHFQEQNGPYGPLVIEPAGPERNPTERDYVVMLNDWTDVDPARIFAILKKQSDYFNFNELTLPDFLRDTSMLGLRGALQVRAMWNQMRMSPRDAIDVSGFTYTYLMNGATPAGNWTGLFKPGERVRLRFINGSANSYFDVRIPGLKMIVISADGQDVHPVTVDEFRIAVAETYDVIVQPQEDHAYTIFAQSIDRSGYARGTLATRTGMEAEVPIMDAVPTLTMVDMMGAMAQGHGMSNMQGMDHGSMSGMDMSTMQGKHQGAMPGMSLDPAGMKKAHHARTEYNNPGVDMHVDWPRTDLNDPGVGLRDNGRRVLTYADLHSVEGPLDPREPDREIEMHLTGNMQRFVWSFDGVVFSDAKPVHFKFNERLRIVLCNDTMMNHPIHLHGIFSELENPQGKVIARKHTINVQPAQRVTYAVTADNPGRWAYHCHLLYHMEAGMFREVVTA